jgi:uncharacterized OB-fold protein
MLMHSKIESRNVVASSLQKTTKWATSKFGCRECGSKCSPLSSICETCGSRDPVRLPVIWLGYAVAIAFIVAAYEGLLG